MFTTNRAQSYKDLSVTPNFCMFICLFCLTNRCLWRAEAVFAADFVKFASFKSHI